VIAYILERRDHKMAPQRKKTRKKAVFLVLNADKGGRKWQNALMNQGEKVGTESFSERQTA